MYNLYTSNSSTNRKSPRINRHGDRLQGGFWLVSRKLLFILKRLYIVTSCTHSRRYGFISVTATGSTMFNTIYPPLLDYTHNSLIQHYCRQQFPAHKGRPVIPIKFFEYYKICCQGPHLKLIGIAIEITSVKKKFFPIRIEARCPRDMYDNGSGLCSNKVFMTINLVGMEWLVFCQQIHTSLHLHQQPQSLVSSDMVAFSTDHCGGSQLC